MVSTHVECFEAAECWHVKVSWRIDPQSAHRSSAWTVDTELVQVSIPYPTCANVPPLRDSYLFASRATFFSLKQFDAR